MAKIIREKYEAGVLVSREIEDSGVSYLKIARLCLQLVIAVSVALIALLNVRDSLSYAELIDQPGISDTACRSPGVRS